MPVPAQHQEPVPPAILHAEFDDPDVIRQAQREAGMEWISTGRDSHRNRLTAIDFGLLGVQSASVGAHLARGQLRSDRVSLVFPLGPTDVTINGWAGTEQGVVFFGPGAEIRTRIAQPLRWMGFALDHARFQGWLDGAELPGRGDFTVAADLRTKMPMLGPLASELAAVAVRDPARLAGAAVSAAVRDTLCGALSGALTPGDRDRRARRQRLRIVAGAEAFLEQRVGRPVYTLDLVEALGVPARSIHTAFVAVYGMSPHQFLQLRRLNLVHRVLRTGAGDARLVKTAALDHGFWHLGRFSEQYRRLFGETPSATLARRGAG